MGHGPFLNTQNMTALTKIKDYFHGAYSEARKVTWPTRKQTINYSILVLGLTVGMTVFFAAVDYALNLGLEQIIK